MPRKLSTIKEAKKKEPALFSRHWEFVLLRVSTPDYPINWRDNCSFCSWSFTIDKNQPHLFNIEGYIQFPSVRRLTTLQRLYINSVWTKAYKTPIYVESAMRHDNSYGVINADRRHWLVPKDVLIQASRLDQNQMLQDFVDLYRYEREAYVNRISSLLDAVDNPPPVPLISLNQTIPYLPRPSSPYIDISACEEEVIPVSPPGSPPRVCLHAPEDEDYSIATILNKLYES